LKEDYRFTWENIRVKIAKKKWGTKIPQLKYLNDQKNAIKLYIYSDNESTLFRYIKVRYCIQHRIKLGYEYS
jgi:hypothetical protein